MYAFIQDVPGNAAIYRRISAAMVVDQVPGLIAHIVIEQQPDGLRYVDVWDSEEHWSAFRDGTLVPAVDQVLGEVGIPHDVSRVRFEEVTVIDAVTSAHPPALVDAG